LDGRPPMTPNAQGRGWGKDKSNCRKLSRAQIGKIRTSGNIAEINRGSREEEQGVRKTRKEPGPREEHWGASQEIYVCQKKGCTEKRHKQEKMPDDVSKCQWGHGEEGRS